MNTNENNEYGTATYYLPLVEGLVVNLRRYYEDAPGAWHSDVMHRATDCVANGYGYVSFCRTAEELRASLTKYDMAAGPLGGANPWFSVQTMAGWCRLDPDTCAAIVEAIVHVVETNDLYDPS